jgi:hypothetical protein
MQGLYLYKKNSNTVLVIDADYFKNSDELMRVLASKKINVIIDKKGSFPSTSFGKIIAKIIVYTFYKIFKDKKINKIFYNGDPSTILRLKAIASSKEIIFMDAGYQHYFLTYMNFKNNFYKNESPSFKILKNLFFGFRLNYTDKKIKNIMFIYEKIFTISNTLPIVEKINKDKLIPNLILEIKNKEVKEVFIKLFPNLQELGIKKEKNIMLITQPLYEDGYMSLDENIKIYDDYLKTLCNQDACIYLKIHPREDNKKYLNLSKKYTLTFLDSFPLEALEFIDINFSLGVTYNSTANYLNCFDAMKFLDKTAEAKN